MNNNASEFFMLISAVMGFLTIVYFLFLYSKISEIARYCWRIAMWTEWDVRRRHGLDQNQQPPQ